jgi:endoglucanase
MLVPTRITAFISLLALLGCAEGTAKSPFDDDEADVDSKADHPGDADSVDERDSGAAASDLPPELALDSDDDGEYGPDELGLTGTWEAAEGPDSEVTLSFVDGGVCLEGETAQVIDNDFGTYWGASATLNLCEGEDGNARPVDECLDGAAVRDFVGVSFEVDGDVIPWIVSVTFNVEGQDPSAGLWVQEAGSTTVLFNRTTHPFDSSVPPVDPRKLESITVRAVGSPDGVATFDFCFSGLKALFGDSWEDALVPDWIDETGPGKRVEYVGANLVGAEFGEQNLPGVYGSDYIYPGSGEVEYYASKGMNIFRVPFRWERMQRELYADLDETELGYLADVVTAAKDNDAVVIVDPHNFARYDLDSEDDEEPGIIGIDIESAAFADFWARLAAEFAGDEQVWFGLVNEPHDMPTETWLDAANEAIAAIRDAGADNLILVPGNQWTGAHSWFETYYGTPNATAMVDVADPLDNFAFELHQYFDSNSSGTSNTCVSEEVGVERVEQVTQWLEDEGFKGFLGEFGGSDDPVCLGAMENLLSHLGDNSDVWLGWTVWAASQWSIQHNVQPLANGDDSMQMKVLLRHMDEP